MQQLEIQYFFPLTEQIPLDLDFSPSVAYEEQKRKEMWANSVTLTVGNGGTTSYTFTASNIPPEEIAKLENLQMLPWKDNISKGK